MSPFLRSLVFTLLLAVAAAAGGAFLCSHVMEMRQAHRGSSLAQAVASLDLTSVQKARVDALGRAHSARRAALEAEMRAANRELAAAIEADHRDSPRVQAAIDRLHHAMGALQKETVAHLFAVRAELSPAQARRFDARIAAALTRPER
jgi:Spy/CpxP family protein refolding chaperone